MAITVGLCRGRPLALEPTVRHDGEAEPHRKRFYGRDDAPGVCSPWRVDSSRSAEFSYKRLPVFAAVYSRSWLDQMGCRASKSRSWFARCGAFRANRAGG